MTKFALLGEILATRRHLGKCAEAQEKALECLAKLNTLSASLPVKSAAVCTIWVGLAPATLTHLTCHKWSIRSVV